MRIGIDIGGMSVKIGIVNKNSEIIARTTIPTDITITPQAFIKEMAGGVHRLIEENQFTMEQIASIGIGCPGAINTRKGLVIFAGNLGWSNVNLVEEFQAIFPMPVGLANDADAAALGEVTAGAAKGHKDVVLITLGTGVGGGIIIDGKIFQGPLNGGCELGHMIIRANGNPCSCGSQGCFESYASATALMAMGREAAKANMDSMLWKEVAGDVEKINGRIIFDCKEAGDKVAKEVLDNYLHYLAIGVTNVINIFRPEVVILGGGVSAQKEKLTDEIQDRINKLVFAPDLCETAKVVTSTLGNDAGIIGAAYIV